MNEECPNCGKITNTSHSRLVRDTCGHTKCRLCLICEEQGCRTCITENSIKNADDYDCSVSTKVVESNISAFDKNIAHNEVLPLELVINKDTKVKGDNSNVAPIDHTDDYESCHEDMCNKSKEICKTFVAHVKNIDISNELYMSNMKASNIQTNAYPRLNSNLIMKSSSCSMPSKVCNLETTTQVSQKEKLTKRKSTKCPSRNHIVTIPGTPEKYKCNICLKIFRNKKGKCYHDACITGIKPYKCTFCDKSFTKRSHFEYHERIHRGHKPFKCNICEKAFPQQNKLNRHMYSHGEKQFVCTKCDKRYTKQDDLKNHLSVHNSTTTYSCKACGKSFRILTNLKRHLKTHTNERPYVCDQCNKSFKHKSLLIRHKKTHGKERPFSCAHCTRVFLSKSELRRHLNVHTDEKPFSCHYCETVFRRKDNLHRHIRHHHSVSPSSNTNVEITTEANSKLVKPTQISIKHKQKTKKSPKITTNPLPKTPAKVSVVCISSCDQISSRLDSMGNITPVIRTTNEVSNAVSVINGPICIKSLNDKSDTKKKAFTYTEPIPLAEAVVINRRIEEKLYPQTVSNHNYLLKSCLNSTDQSYPRFTNQVTRAKTNFRCSEDKTNINENSFSETGQNIQTSFTYNAE